MQMDFDFADLFVLDMANNHQGDLQHGLAIVRSMAEAARKHEARAAMKFQFRQLDSFIHPAHQRDSDLKYIQRFVSTRMHLQDYELLLEETRANGLLAVCTPFDEESVPIIAKMGFDCIKVASCSAKDWPLLGEIADAGLPVICSTGGLDLNDIDNVVSFFKHRGVHFALMHCVSIYPTPDEMLCLNQIQALRRRYADVPVGWSTHESPADTVPVGLATALGAELFERHVGIETSDIKLNAYSSTPDQVGAWLAAQRRARQMCGPAVRPPVSKEEQNSIDGLRRSVYARRQIKDGAEIARGDVYFAMPYLEGTLESGAWKPGIRAKKALAVDSALALEAVSVPTDPDVQVLKKAIHEVKALLNEAGVVLGPDFKVEYSHHYGIRNFRETGAVLIECINREYCKKLVIQLPEQRHPSHYHAKKEETFQVLYGVLDSVVDGRHRTLQPGDTVLVQPGVWHSFSTQTGAVFEEISTTHYNDDSRYEDKRINAMSRSERKTVVDHWGRFQLGNDAEAR